MAKNKTTETEIDVFEFINSYVENQQKKSDSLQLVALMSNWSGCEPKMWGPTIIGFGSYHYKYDSGHQGDAPLIGFSPRKAEFSLYVYMTTIENDAALKNLGKFKMGKSCIYIKSISEVNLPTLEKIAKQTIAFLNQKYTNT